MRYEADNIDAPNLKLAPKRSRGFWDDIVLNKFSKPQLILFMVIVAAAIVYTYANNDGVSAPLLVIALLGIVVVYGVIANAKFGITVLFVSGYLLGIPGKMSIDFPLGTLLDLFNILLLIGFFFRQKVNRNFKIFKNPIAIWLLIWILYNLAELGNPVAASRVAWLYTIRSTAIIILTYYIFVFEIRDIAFIKFLFKVWLCLAFIGALNGFHQEYFGFFAYEKKWLYSDPLRVELYFQAGHMRKVSIFPDPVSFAYNMAAVATLCAALAFGPYKTYKKLIIIGLALFCLASMIFSGTRGAFPLAPCGMAMLALLKFNRRVMIFSIIFGIFFVGLIFVPSGNQNILRFQSAFKPNNDMSYKARKINQERIRPFIQTHPMGGGLGTTGYWGQRFSPGTMLANFPPDSGYVRVAVELGTIGIIILCTMIFVALKTGINNYYLIKDPELKTFCMAAVMILFVYNVANYPQEAFAQYPSNIIFFFCMSLITITKHLDDQQQLAAQNEE